MHFFIPLTYSSSTTLPFNKAISLDTSTTINNSTPKDSAYTINAFLDTMRYNPAEATKYISKNYKNKVDIDIVPQGINTPILSGANYDKLPHNCKAHTVLTFSDDGVAFLHFYTLLEKDKASTWKIYALEKELI